jgi:SRSO17 transposase
VAGVLAERGRLLESLRPCFARTQVWLQAGRYVTALMSDLPGRNGWSIARFCGDRTPDKTQRLLDHASWDTLKAMSIVRRSAAAGLDEAARRNRRAGGMRVGALDETGQGKHGTATAGVKRQYLGCAGRVANGINAVHLAYVREGTGHALIGARQWIPREQIAEPARALATGLPPGLAFRTKGQLAAGLCADAYADGLAFDFACGDEVYGASPDLREYLESRSQACVLRVASNFPLTLARGTAMTCAQAVKRLLNGKRSWEVRSAGQGSKGAAVVCLGLARHRLAPALPAHPPSPGNR